MTRTRKPTLLRPFGFPQTGEFQPVYLRRYGGNWIPLARPSQDEALAWEIAETKRLSDDSIPAVGVLDGDLVVHER